MQKQESPKIHVLDNSVREQMKTFDRYGDNFFSDTLTLIMNFEPYVKRVRLGRPVRTPEHRIILVRHGSTTVEVSRTAYTLKVGHLMIVPANAVITKTAQSDNYNIFCIAFRIPEVEHLGLVDYKERHIVLDEGDRKVVENYFRLTEQLVRAENVNRRSINHLIISMLYGLYSIYGEDGRPVGPVKPDRAQEIMNGFTRLLMEQEFPARKPDHYAEALSISKGHLSDVVKERSGRTVMDWINDRTLQLAQAMLASTEEKVEDIAKQLHIGDTSQFVRFFRKYAGETPLAYRKRMQQQ